MSDSTTPTERLADLNIILPPVAAPVAAYVPAVRSGDLVFTSGQLPFERGVLPATGAVGEIGPVSPQDAAHYARIATLNALAAINELVGIDSIVQIVKVVGFVASTPGFGGQPAVINGASELLGEVFSQAGAHARSAVGVAELPLGSPVEIELIVRIKE